MTNKDEKRTYEEYVASIHAKIETPKEVIESVILEATGARLAIRERILAGEANEVYGIETEKGDSIILRISHSNPVEFEQEQWAIDECKKHGALVPTVLLIKRITLPGEEIGICVQERLPGDPLTRGRLDVYTMDKELVRSLLQQAGAQLSIIHSVRPEGFGALNAKGQGEFPSLSKLLREHVSQGDVYLPLAERSGLEKEKMNRILKILDDSASRYEGSEPHLIHNDFGPKHIMVKDNVLTGVIDWGSAASHTPVTDFAGWQFWFPSLPLEWLKEGYENKELFEGNFEETLSLVMLNKALGALHWYDEQGYKEGASSVVQKILAILEKF